MQCPRCGNKKNFILIQAMKAYANQEEGIKNLVVENPFFMKATLICKQCNKLVEQKIPQPLKSKQLKVSKIESKGYEVSIDLEQKLDGKAFRVTLTTSIDSSDDCGGCEAKKRGLAQLMKAIKEMKPQPTILSKVKVKGVRNAK